VLGRLRQKNGAAVSFGRFAARGTDAALPQRNTQSRSGFASFAVSVIMRPARAALFGELADRKGRKAIMVAVLAGVGLSTAAMGLVPTYAAIGLAAPIIFSGIARRPRSVRPRRHRDDAHSRHRERGAEMARFDERPCRRRRRRSRRGHGEPGLDRGQRTGP
jgi:hypothetical protein